MTLEDIAARLDVLLTKVEAIETKIATWERLLPDPDSIAGKAVARRIRKQTSLPPPPPAFGRPSLPVTYPKLR